MKVVFVTGNICSGKSTCLKALKDKYPNVNILSIDDIRLEMKVDNWVTEAEAWQKMYERVCDLKHENKKSVFVESSGTGKNFTGFYQAVKKDGFDTLIIKVDTRPDVCLERFKMRPAKGLFFEAKYNIKDSINRAFIILMGAVCDIIVNGNKSEEVMAKEFLMKI